MSKFDCGSTSFGKLVHFDLKGAPPVVDYFKQVFPFLKMLGATGILIEYEDMFPYQGNLQNICHPEAYTLEKIEKIKSWAEESKLDIIPLVQSFDNLEFLLKHNQYYELREVDRYPNILCPSHPKSEQVISDMVTQILDFHKNSKYIHISGGQVRDLKPCQKCKNRMNSLHQTKEVCFIDFLLSIIRKIRDTNQHVQIIIWDEILRDIDIYRLNALNLGKELMPMIRHYLPKSDLKLERIIEKRYSGVFPCIWIASAFKGESDITQLIPDTKLYISNHEAWITILNSFTKQCSKVLGIAMMGCQRFDHYTVLCELLPVALPTLAICILTLREGTFNEDVHKRASSLLGFETLIEIDPNSKSQAVGKIPTFPGGNIQNGCLQLNKLMKEYHLLMHLPSIRGAFSDYQLHYNQISTIHIDEFLPKAEILLMNLESINLHLQNELSKIFYFQTVDEFLSVNIKPYLEKLRQLVQNARTQIMLHSTIS